MDEIEQAVVSPVQVFEHEHEWMLLCERLEVAAPGAEALGLTVPLGLFPSD